MIRRNKKKGLYDMRAGRMYRKGDYKIFCPVCAMIGCRSDSRHRWDGVLVCNKCYDPKHPQEEVPILPENEAMAIQDARPEAEDTFKTDQTENDL